MNRRVDVDCMHEELRLAARRFPDALARRHAEVKAARVLQALVVIVEAVDHLRDAVANQRVVRRLREPIHLAAAERRMRHPRDDRDLRQQILRRRLVHAVRDVHHAHRILDAHALRHAVLQVDLGAPERRQDQRVAAVHEMAAIQLGRDVHGQIARAHRFPRARRVRRRDREVAAEADEHLHLAVEHRLNRVDHVEPVLARRLEIVDLAEPVEKRLQSASPRCRPCGRPARSSVRAPGTGPRRAGRYCRASSSGSTASAPSAPSSCAA